MLLPISKDVAKNRIVQTVSIAELLRLMGRSGIWVFIPIYLLDKGSSYLDVGILFLLSSVAAIPASLFGGNLIDSIGRRRVALILPPAMSLLFLVMFIGMYFSLSQYVVYLTFVLFSAVATLQSVTDMVIITDTTLDIDRIDAFSLTRIGANVGFSLGPAISGYVVSFNYSILPLIPMVLEFFGLVLFYRFVKYKEENVSRGKSMISFPRGDRRFLFISVILSLAFFSMGPWAYILPQFFSRVDGISTTLIGLLFATNGVIVVTLQLPVNRLFYKFQDMSRVSIGLVIYAVTFLIFGLTTNIPLLFVDVIFLTIGENVVSPPMNSIIGRIAPENRRGEYYGGFSLLNNFISPISPIAYEAMLSFLFDKPFILWAGIAIICVALAAAVPMTKNKWAY
ncbi:MAG: MFS transporter [Thermoplasmatales archaeon]